MAIGILGNGTKEDGMKETFFGRDSFGKVSVLQGRQ